jgi:REP element-mobilizing transposase RayT
VNKGLIFFSDSNYKYFLNKLSFFFQNKAKVIAYCLMPNHFHILVRVTSDDFVNTALHPFLVSYSKSINLEQDRTGPLFQGRYQDNLIEDEEYLLDCAKYIHLNPVKAGLVSSPIKWEYSSYRAYINPKDHSVVDTSFVMNYFDSVKEFRDFVEYGIEEYQSKYFTEK